MTAGLAPASSAAPAASRLDPDHGSDAAVTIPAKRATPVARGSKPTPVRRTAHVVVPGDTLSGIAVEAGVSLACLIRTNHPANPDLIYPGQRIQLSCSGGSKAGLVKASAHPAKHEVNKPRRYYYRDGDGRLRWTTHYGTYLTHKYDAATPARRPSHVASSQTHSSRSGARAPLAQGNGRAYARSIMAGAQFSCFSNIVERESGWNPRAQNPSSGAYGLVQANPGSKMASVGADWRTNPATQIRWGLRYMDSRYGSPCEAWSFWLTHRYY
jgi:LysM repeat protein